MISLNSLLADLRSGHDAVQIDGFILRRSGLTTYGTYIQALRELRSRRDTALTFFFEVEKLQIRLDELDHEIETCGENQFQLRRLKLERVEKRATLDLFGPALRDHYREFARFYAHAVTLRGKLGELTDARREQFEREFWLMRLKVRAASEVKTMGHVSGDTVELALSLPTDMRADLLRHIGLESSEPGCLVEWLQALAVPELKLPPVGEEDILHAQKLLGTGSSC